MNTSPKLLLLAPVALALLFAACGRDDTAHADTKASGAPAVAVTRVGTKALSRNLTMSAELVPFQEIDVYAKESGYVSKLLVDYGTHVHKGQLMATLEIPELQALLQEDEAGIRSAQDQVTNAEHQLARVEAQYTVAHLQYQRLAGVAQSKPGLVAQQEVDEAHGHDLAAEAQVEGAKAALSMAQSQLAVAQSKKAHDQALFSYSNITAPFDGVVTQRYANFGTLMQAGTSSSSALPLVKLSQENLFRLVIPVPETYVQYIKVGDPVSVRVPSLNRSFPGSVSRFSVDVTDSTRTMHTEVDVPNPQGVLIPGVYAEATLSLDRKGDATAVPLQAVDDTNGHATVLVVDDNDRIQSRNVQLGIQTATDAEVLSGLRPGENVVIGERGGLKPGELVVPKETQVAAYTPES